jgi:hypothetical protein
MTTSIIFNIDEISKVNFTEVIQTLETLQYSVNRQKTYVSWNGSETPSFVSNITSAEGPYSQSELLDILERLEWLLIADTNL